MAGSLRNRCQIGRNWPMGFTGVTKDVLGTFAGTPPVLMASTS